MAWYGKYIQGKLRGAVAEDPSWRGQTQEQKEEDERLARQTQGPKPAIAPVPSTPGYRPRYGSAEPTLLGRQVEKVRRAYLRGGVPEVARGVGREVRGALQEGQQLWMGPSWRPAGVSPIAGGIAAGMGTRLASLPEAERTVAPAPPVAAPLAEMEARERALPPVSAQTEQARQRPTGIFVGGKPWVPGQPTFAGAPSEAAPYLGVYPFRARGPMGEISGTTRTIFQGAQPVRTEPIFGTGRELGGGPIGGGVNVGTEEERAATRRGILAYGREPLAEQRRLRRMEAEAAVGAPEREAERAMRREQIQAEKEVGIAAAGKGEREAAITALGKVREEEIKGKFAKELEDIKGTFATQVAAIPGVTTERVAKLNDATNRYLGDLKAGADLATVSQKFASDILTSIPELLQEGPTLARDESMGVEIPPEKTGLLEAYKTYQRFLPPAEGQPKGTLAGRPQQGRAPTATARWDTQLGVWVDKDPRTGKWVEVSGEA